MKRVLAAAGLLLSVPVMAGDSDRADVERLLQAPRSPDGIVFEIMAWEDGSWEWASPLLREYVERLRARYPGLEVALISHGAEMFDLVAADGAPRNDAIDALASLGIDIHVCGEYARYKRLGQKDFPAHVDVAASGSALLEDYRRLGFVHIRLEPPHATD